MRRTSILLAGVFLSVAVLAGSGDRSAEERYRMKTGRYTPAEEARQKALKATQDTGEGQACCRYIHKNEAAGPASLEARYRMKYGRSAPAVEAPEKAVMEATAMHVKGCVELGKCALMTAEQPAAQTSTATAGDQWREARSRMKYGRSLPAGEPPSPQLVASAGGVTCEHACCMRAQ